MKFVREDTAEEVGMSISRKNITNRLPESLLFFGIGEK